MTALGTAIVEAIVISEGVTGFLSRLSDPFWFQAFGAVLGMDWHSSGITTSVMGALKRGLAPQAKELGLAVCGGRGRHSRNTPLELLQVAERTGLDGDALVRASKLVAKVDNTAVQDGYALYLHTFVVTDEGQWVVVQQGMHGAARDARRYHWKSDGITSFVEAPHTGMVGPNMGKIVNLTDKRAALARQATLSLTDENPDRILGLFCSIASKRCLTMPRHHDVRPTDVFLKRLLGVLCLANKGGVSDFEDLLLTKGLGPRTMQALALVAEVVCGAPSRFDDPARFAFAHGGKDGHPHPVPLNVYDNTIHALRHSLDRARIGDYEKMAAFQRLDRQARALERLATGPTLERIIDDEWQNSPDRGGMTVFGPVTQKKRNGGADKRAPKAAKQLRLFA